MKRLIFLLSLVTISLFSFSQSANTGTGFTNGRAVDMRFRQAQLNFSYTLTADTAKFSWPKDCNELYLRVNPADSLKTAFTLYVADYTSKGVTYTDDNLRLGDKLYVQFKSDRSKVDTIKFAGNIECDSSSTAGSKTMMTIKVDATKDKYLIPFIWNGTKFVEQTLGTSGGGR